MFVVAPSYQLLDPIWDEVVAMAPPENIVSIDRSEPKRIVFKGDVRLEFRTAGLDPGKLRGVGMDTVLLTQAPLISQAMWQETIRPRLASPGRSGMVIAEGCPRGRNYFCEMFLRGQVQRKKITSR